MTRERRAAEIAAARARRGACLADTPPGARLKQQLPVNPRPEPAIPLPAPIAAIPAPCQHCWVGCPLKMSGAVEITGNRW
jgi:hypothetical protein